MQEWLLPIICGLAVGFSLGLTGGGGSIFAVPLLIYILGSDVREAVGISLIVVGSTALFGALLRARKGEIEWKTGLIFAAAGMIAAPLGTTIGAQLPEALTLAVFALLMIYVGLRMWRGGSKKNTDKKPSSCARCEQGHLILTPKCFAVLILAGITAGILAGIFGVGGGFIIVPALILVSNMLIHRAVSTSLLVIALICASGVISHFAHGHHIPVSTTAIFVGGGFLGMFGGVGLRSSLPELAMKRTFAVAMWAIAIFMLVKNLPTMLHS